MTEFIMGGAQSGKTTEVFTRIKALCEQNKKVFYLVPEQFALEAETRLFSYLGSSLFEQARVISFSRLAHELFTAYGMLAGRYANDCVKIVYMSRAIEQVKNELIIYQKTARYQSFCKTMLDTVTELKNAGVSPARLLEAASKSPDTYLRDKLNEIALIYGIYEALLSSGHSDSENDPARILDLLAEHNFFANSTVFIDEFKGFTRVELDIIMQLMRQCDTVCVSLCCLPSKGGESRSSPFASVYETYQALVRTAHKVSSAVAPPMRLDASYFNNPALGVLDKLVFSPVSSKAVGLSADLGISLISCKNEYDEVDVTLSMICKLVRENGYSYRDIAILSRDMSAYSSILQTGCEKYEIPFYDDCVDNILHKPLIRFINALLEIAANGLDTEHILALLKCGMTPFGIEEIAALENYAFIWGITPKQWRKPFDMNPRGFKGELTAADKDELALVNKQRAFMAACVGDFESDINTSGSYCKSLFLTLERLKAREKNQEIIHSLYEKEDFSAAGDYTRVWEITMELLDSLELSLSNTRVKAKRFSELFLQAAKSYDMGTLPPSLDTVVAGSAERIRTASKKAIFILGANEGAFPKTPKARGVFTDKERRALSGMEIELSKPLLEQLKEERFIAYKAMTSPSDKLFLTYRRAGLDGTTFSPSPVIYRLCGIFGEELLCDSADFPPEFFCPTKQAAFARLALCLDENTPFANSLRQALLKTPAYESRVKRLLSVRKGVSFSLSNKENARKLFGSEMYISPTRVESFYRCAFRYFCEHGLRALSLKKAELNPMETGTLIHSVLEVVAQRMDFKAPFDKRLAEKLIKEELDRYIAEIMGGEEDKTGRFLYLYRRMKAALLTLCEQLHDELFASEFTPCAFEYEIGTDAEVTPLRLYGENDVAVYISGKIDRIDSYINKNGQKYIRIVDYKSGKKEFNLNDVLHGLNLQMLIYLHCIVQNGTGEYENVLPAGILYRPAGEKAGTLDRTADEQAQLEQKRKAYRMNGLLLCEPEVLHAMETPLDGIFIPVTEKNDGTFSSKSANSLMTLSEFGKISRYIDSLIISMANELQGGNISALPLDGSCDFCDYHGVCGVSDSCQKREYIKLAHNIDILEQMEQPIKPDDIKTNIKNES